MYRAPGKVRAYKFCMWCLVGLGAKLRGSSPPSNPPPVYASGAIEFCLSVCRLLVTRRCVMSKRLNLLTRHSSTVMVADCHIINSMTALPSIASRPTRSGSNCCWCRLISNEWEINESLCEKGTHRVLDHINSLKYWNFLVTKPPPSRLFATNLYVALKMSVAGIQLQSLHGSQKTHQLWNGVVQNYN